MYNQQFQGTIFLMVFDFQGKVFTIKKVHLDSDWSVYRNAANDSPTRNTSMIAVDVTNLLQAGSQGLKTIPHSAQNLRNSESFFIAHKASKHAKEIQKSWHNFSHFNCLTLSRASSKAQSKSLLSTAVPGLNWVLQMLLLDEGFLDSLLEKQTNTETTSIHFLYYQIMLQTNSPPRTQSSFWNSRSWTSKQIKWHQMTGAQLCKMEQYPWTRKLAFHQHHQDVFLCV